MKIIYVNGDSHAAAAEAVVPCAFAEDDEFYYGMGRRPHPENERVSWGCEIANQLGAVLQLDAESASSNYRIERTTREWINNPSFIDYEQIVLIGWSTWEREEWLIDDVYYQVGSSGIDDVPETHQQQYKDFVINVNWQQVTEYWHNRIWQLHLDLKENNIPHVFFNCNNSFEKIAADSQYDWGANYISPYSADGTYDQRLRQMGHDTVSADSWHFGPNAHRNWAEFMLQYIYNNKILGTK